MLNCMFSRIQDMGKYICTHVVSQLHKTTKINVYFCFVQKPNQKEEVKTVNIFYYICTYKTHKTTKTTTITFPDDFSNES